MEAFEEFLNAQLIEKEVPPKARLEILNEEANKEKELFNNNVKKQLGVNSNITFLK